MEPVPGKQVQVFSYVDQNGKTQKVSVQVDSCWSDIKTDDANLNSIYDTVDKNGDGIAQGEELDLLNKLLDVSDKFFEKTANNKCLEQEELIELKKQVDEGKIDIEELQKGTLPAGAWSEGIDRVIGKISISNTKKYPFLQKVYEELKAIGEEQGFAVERIESGGDPWLEDLKIRRADNKIYIPVGGGTFDNIEFTDELEPENSQTQENAPEEGGTADSETSEDDAYQGNSYLEGGNVLNTIKANGQAGAVVGEDSIGQTLLTDYKEVTPENVQSAKQQIAEDLGLNINDVAFIPQFDFHIDMAFRPLHNGQFAVSDFDEAIKILEDNTGSTQKEELIEQLKVLRDETKPVIDEAIEKLKSNGYEIVKIPSFATSTDETTNYMNGVGGTSDKTGQSYYITNRSPHPELNKIVTKYFQNAGIDRVYFVSTEDALKMKGGIDCLTQEAPRM